MSLEEIRALRYKWEQCENVIEAVKNALESALHHEKTKNPECICHSCAVARVIIHVIIRDHEKSVP